MQSVSYALLDFAKTLAVDPYLVARLTKISNRRSIAVAVPSMSGRCYICHEADIAK